MHRHDGNEYVGAIFNGHTPDMKQSIAFSRYSQESTDWNLPILSAQVLLVAEIIRTYPAEIRMFMRLVRRKKPNMAELLFLLIKYGAFIAVVCDIIVSTTFAAKTDMQCHALAWTSSTLYFLCSFLVFCVIVWRGRIIFRTCAWIHYLFYAGLALQLALSLWTNYRVDKLDGLSPSGACVPAKMLHNEHYEDPGTKMQFWASSTFWFLLYNTLFGLSVLVACCLRLRMTSSGPGGLTQIAKVLFYNNVHYILGVETCNAIELILLLGWISNLPPLHSISIAVQIVVGIQMLICEQEAVYSPAYMRRGYGASDAAYTAGSGYANCSPPTASTTSSNRTKIAAFLKRPGTAGTTNTDHPDHHDHSFVSHESGGRCRKDTLSSLCPLRSTKAERPPQVPPKSSEVALNMTTDDASAGHFNDIPLDHREKF